MTVGVVLMAYGTPRHPDEIEPYYTDIRRGRPPTPEQLADLVRRYDAIGGISPLAQRTEAQRDAVAAALDAEMPGGFAVEIGLRHVSPDIESAVANLAGSGVERIVGLVMAPHYSTMSIAVYAGRAQAAAEAHDLPFAMLERWGGEPAYVDFLAAEVSQALGDMPAGTKVLFTAHSLPRRILDVGDAYPDELLATATAVSERVGLGSWSRWAMAWQSAGRTPEPWLGPDVLAVIDDLAASEHAAGLLVCPCGFVSDHLEVLYDLDIEAADRARARGLAFARTATPNDDPAVMAALARRVVELSR